MQILSIQFPQRPETHDRVIPVTHYIRVQKEMSVVPAEPLCGAEGPLVANVGTLTVNGEPIVICPSCRTLAAKTFPHMENCDCCRAAKRCNQCGQPANNVQRCHHGRCQACCRTSCNHRVM